MQYETLKQKFESLESWNYGMLLFVSKQDHCVQKWNPDADLHLE